MVQLDEQVLRRLHRARCCVFEMFRDRGYALRSSPYPEAEFAARLCAVARARPKPWTCGACPSRATK